MGAIASDGNKDLFEEGFDIGRDKSSKSWDRLHRAIEGCASHFYGTAWNLNKKPDRRIARAEKCLHARTALPADRGHLDDSTVRIHRNDRHNAGVGKENVIKRTIRICENLFAATDNMFKVG